MKLKPVDIVIFSLTFCVLLIPLGVLIMALRGLPESEQGNELLYNIIVAALAIISLYVGLMLRSRHHDDEDDS